MENINLIEEPAIAAVEPRTEARDADLAPVAPPDRHIWGIYILLCLVSIVELYSASSREVSTSGLLGIFTPIVRHCVFLLAGLGIILFLQHVHYRKFFRWIPLFTFVSMLMMVYVLIAGTDINGAKRSFSFMGATIQPSEFLKLSAAAMIAWIMSKSQLRGSVRPQGIIATTVMVVMFAGLLISEGLTNTLLLIGISVSMMIVGGVSLKKVFMALLCLVAGVTVLYLIHRLMLNVTGSGFLDRIDVWISRVTQFFGDGTPKYAEKLTSKNSQEMYSYMAQAHGGLFGVGPGNSREVARLPLAFSDYIFSVIVEEIGLIGGVAVIMAYLWLLGRASAIASKCTRAFPAFLVIGMALVIVFQAMFHIAIVTGVFPVSGQPLPLISKGGTSIIVTSIAFGVMLSVSRFAVRNGSKKDIKLEIESLPEDGRAENPSLLS